MGRSFISKSVATAGVVWLLAISGGMWTLLSYQNAPGGISDFGPKGQRWVAENKIGDLGKAFPSNRIKGVQLDVLLLDQLAEGFHDRLIIS